MIVRVDLAAEPPAVTLEEPEDCRRFHVEAAGPGGGEGDPARLGAALEDSGVGRLHPAGDALIEIAAVRRLAAGRVPAGWEVDFAAMLGYARGKGWLDERGEAIQAHVEWTG